MAAVENEIPPDVQSTDRGAFRCLLCGVTVPNYPTLTDHLQGRRHKRMCEERDRRQQQQERSVFVSGFPKDTSEEQLKDVFERICPVQKIVMDKDRGLYAIVEFEGPDGVGLALSQTHIALEGHRLRVRPRKKTEFKNKKAATQRSLQPPDPETLSKQLLRCTDIEDQMKNLVSLCSPSHEESRLRELLLSLLRETFTEFFPGCQLLPFGSSINGFEVTGCDLDLHLELGESQNEEDDEEEEEEEEETGRPSGENEAEHDEEPEEGTCPMKHEEEPLMDVTEESEDEENITPGLSLQGLSHKEILDVVERVLRQCVPGVHGVQSVPSARRPVIRFQHKTSGLRGDITLNNRLALRNSSYLRLCSDLDPRVPQLVYTVRYWARAHQLAGNPLGGGPLLNNYALTLLVIFFLQTRSPPVLPSLSRLREIAQDDASHVIDSWDCSFAADSTQIPASENQQSLSCLLSEFFGYFSSLDLHSNILCLCDGRLVPLPISSPPPPWADGFRIGPFNVQDPFELNHNICSNVSSRIACRFSAQCSSAAKTCRAPSYPSPSSSRPWGVPLLIQPSPSEADKTQGTDIAIFTGKASLEEVSSALKTVLVEVLLCSQHQDSGQDGAGGQSGVLLCSQHQDSGQDGAGGQSGVLLCSQHQDSGKDAAGVQSGVLLCSQHRDSGQDGAGGQSGVLLCSQHQDSGQDGTGGQSGVLLCSQHQDSGKDGAGGQSGVLLCSQHQDSGKDGASVQSGKERDHEVPRVGELVIEDKGAEVKERHEGDEGIKNERKRESPDEIQNTGPKKRRKEDGGGDHVTDRQRNISEEPLRKKGNASKAPKKPTEEGVQSMKMEVWHRVWEGRRKVRRNMEKEEAPGIKLETAVSRALSAGAAEGGRPIMQITLKTQLGADGNAQVRLAADSDGRGCSATFFHFLKVFLPRMVQEVLSHKD